MPTGKEYGIDGTEYFMTGILYKDMFTLWNTFDKLFLRAGHYTVIFIGSAQQSAGRKLLCRMCGVSFAGSFCISGVGQKHA